MAGVPDFQAVGKEHDLDRCVAGVIPMSHGIDNSLGHDIAGDFVSDRRPWPLGASADPGGKLRHDEINRLIHQFEDRSLVDLIGRDRFADLRAMKMHALHFGADEKALGFFPEQKYRGMARPVAVKQVEMN